MSSLPPGCLPNLSRLTAENLTSHHPMSHPLTYGRAQHTGYIWQLNLSHRPQYKSSLLRSCNSSDDETWGMGYLSLLSQKETLVMGIMVKEHSLATSVGAHWMQWPAQSSLQCTTDITRLMNRLHSNDTQMSPWWRAHVQIGLDLQSGGNPQSVSLTIQVLLHVVILKQLQCWRKGTCWEYCVQWLTLSSTRLYSGYFQIH